MKRLMTCLRCVALSLCVINSVNAAEKPNIVLLFIDDWAWNCTPIPMSDGMEQLQANINRKSDCNEDISNSDIRAALFAQYSLTASEWE